MSIEGCPDRLEFDGSVYDMDEGELSMLENMIRQCGCEECMQDVEMIERARKRLGQKEAKLASYRKEAGITEIGE